MSFFQKLKFFFVIFHAEKIEYITNIVHSPVEEFIFRITKCIKEQKRTQKVLNCIYKVHFSVIHAACSILSEYIYDFVHWRGVKGK